MTPQEFIAERREAAKRLDPETATVFGQSVDVSDPYGVYGNAAYGCIGRLLFACSPDTGAIEFGDLADETRESLEERMKSGAFDADELDLRF